MPYENKRNPRSQAYQAQFCEISCGTDFLDTLTSTSGLYQRLNPFGYSDEIYELEEDLKKELWRLIKNNVKPKHLQMLKLMAEGKTQEETAQVLGVNQSTVNKTIFGSQIKKEFKPGITSKLQTLMKSDKKIQALLRRLSDLREDFWVVDEG